MKKRNIDAETKIAVVLEGLRGETSISELCRKYQISDVTYYKWRDKFLEGGKRAFLDGDSGKTNHLEKKVSELERIIGKQAIQIEILKKTSKMM
ncbi:MAG: transposase family protein [Deferribacteraceae bacterium]|jgi:transposase-like protein|nr:transposase family protein [Deferribacteraceae bacterium]